MRAAVAAGSSRRMWRGGNRHSPADLPLPLALVRARRLRECWLAIRHEPQLRQLIVQGFVIVANERAAHFRDQQVGELLAGAVQHLPHRGVAHRFAELLAERLRHLRRRQLRIAGAEAQHGVIRLLAVLLLLGESIPGSLEDLVAPAIGEFAVRLRRRVGLWRGDQALGLDAGGGAPLLVAMIVNQVPQRFLDEIAKPAAPRIGVAERAAQELDGKLLKHLVGGVRIAQHRDEITIDRAGVTLQERLLRLRKLCLALSVGVVHQRPHRFDPADPAGVFFRVHGPPFRSWPSRFGALLHSLLSHKLMSWRSKRHKKPQNLGVPRLPFCPTFPFFGDLAMLRKIVVLTFAFTLALVCGLSEADKDKKKTGTIIGELKSRKDTPNAKNVFLEIQAAGEEAPRKYRVQYDKKANGPIPDVLAATKAAKIGDRVQCDWINTGEGLAITSFQVLKKTDK